MESNHRRLLTMQLLTGKLTNWIPAADLNRALLITKQVRRHLRLRGTHWSLVPESNWVLRDTNPEHRRQCLRGECYRCPNR